MKTRWCCSRATMGLGFRMAIMLEPPPGFGKGKALLLKGVRVPCIARWPGTIPAGRVSGVHWMTIDVLPTIAALIDAPLPEKTIDGRDATLVLLDEKRVPSRATSAFYYHTGQLEAVRKDAGSSTCRIPTAPCRGSLRGWRKARALSLGCQDSRILVRSGIRSL